MNHAKYIATLRTLLWFNNTTTDILSVMLALFQCNIQVYKEKIITRHNCVQ